MDTQTGYNTLLSTIDKGYKHKHYQRTIELRKDYYTFMTGVGIIDKIKQITASETADAFLQRKLLFQYIIKGDINSTKLPFAKVARTKPVENKIDSDQDQSSESIAKIKDKMQSYNATGYDDFMKQSAIDYNFIDPNAWFITEFEQIDNAIYPYPFIATAEEAIDFNYLNNGKLDYLIIRQLESYQEDNEAKIGDKYYIYLGMDSITATQVSIKENDPDSQYHITANEKKKYRIDFYNPKIKEVQAVRFGYIPDIETNGKTFVSVIHNGMPVIENILKVISEECIGTKSIVFPKQFAYLPACNNAGCSKGRMADGAQCNVCHGTGVKPQSNSLQDITVLDLPRDPTDAFDLSKLVYVQEPPIEGLKYMREKIREFKIDLYDSIFNPDVFNRPNITATATENLLSRDNLNDTLHPFSIKYSQLYEFGVRMIGYLLDVPKIIVKYKLPSVFNFKTVGELFDELQKAKTAGASTATISSIENKINEIIYYDMPDEFNKTAMKNKLNPFYGKSENEIISITSYGKNVLKSDIVLYQNFEKIFSELEYENQYPWLYDLNETEIRRKLGDKVTQLMNDIEAEKPAPMSFNLDDNQEQEQDEV